MASAGLYDSFLTFLSEGLRIVGWSRLLLGLLALVAIGAGALWFASKLLCRGEKHLAASLTAPLMLVLVAAMVGAVYLLTVLREPTTLGDSNTGMMLMASGAIAVVLVFLGVQGGFGTSLP